MLGQCVPALRRVADAEVCGGRYFDPLAIGYAGDAGIRLLVSDRRGLLADVAMGIADAGANIDNVSMKRRTQDFTDVTIDLTVWDLKHLNAIIAELRAKRVVSRVDRVTG